MPPPEWAHPHAPIVRFYGRGPMDHLTPHRAPLPHSASPCAHLLNAHRHAPSSTTNAHPHAPASSTTPIFRPKARNAHPHAPIKPKSPNPLLARPYLSAAPPSQFDEYLGPTMSTLGTKPQFLSQTMSTLGTKLHFLSQPLLPHPEFPAKPLPVPLRGSLLAPLFLRDFVLRPLPATMWSSKPEQPQRAQRTP